MSRVAMSVLLVGVFVGIMTWSALAQPDAPRAQGPDFTARLLGALRETEGCLKAEAVQFQDGRLAILAWFQNKDAAVRWYNNGFHQRMVAMTGGKPEDRQPLEHVKDPNQPLMVIASMVMDPANKRVPGPMPISEISIEIYTPVPGGAMIGGRLAPKGFEVPHMRELKTQPQDNEPAQR